MKSVVLCALILGVHAEDYKFVNLNEGVVRGEKYWDGDFYEFYGIPYASVPTGRDRYQAPLPPTPWEGVFEASKKNTLCHQCYYSASGDDEDEVVLSGDDECLTMNLLVPEVADKDNLVPVVAYIHSGAFSGGSGNMARAHYLARHDVLVVSFNYRLGAIGFACLGTKEVPGNAGLKDQLAALRWIQKNIKKFGGDRKKVTLAGFSVGGAMAELLTLSKAAEGLFDKLILESGSALSPFAINRDPVATAKNIAVSLGYNGTGSVEDLSEFYINADIKDLAFKSLNYFLPNSTFGFAPCVENVIEGIESIITESPVDIIKNGKSNDVTIMTGFSNMEGISRTIKFGTWREEMNDNFADFLPADLAFDNDKSKEDFIKAVKEYYFDSKPVSSETLQNYVNYFSDSMFKYGILRSAKLHADVAKKTVFLYEFSYVGKLNIEHNYMDKIKGASHRDQTAYILDFFGYTTNYKDLDTRDRMTTMWSDFIKYGDPTAYESSLITLKWRPYTNKMPYYLDINRKLLLKTDLNEDGYKFWDRIYKKFYWNPTAPLKKNKK